ncbi:MAG: hypothetical protein JEZ09_15400 [Salinivirgaceae bacterium]|nr:hypothetical protein [Salinivirgaceae bacterium]
MIQIELERALRLIHSPKFRDPQFYKTFNYLNENGLLHEEKAFLIEYEEEGIEKCYTHYLIAKVVWILMFPLALLSILQLGIGLAVIAFIALLILHVLVRRFRNNYILSQTWNEFTYTVYDNLIAKKYNF